ncbi:MAG: phosphate acyltransferase PlsX [Proteobacteria bacterium]|nr:phosphate acyltransferase PlsX [Pseudomonadota bacterium]
MTIRIAIDAMGGDHGPVVTVAAAAQALARHASLELVLVGDEPTLARALAASGLGGHARVSIEHASQVVEMHEKPSSALRGKRESSMRKAIDQVKDGRAMACVSAGNTGALMAIARFVLKTLPGIDRPAICATLPGKLKSTHVLDLGANVDSTSEELFRFAVMGAVLAEAVDNRQNPTVALLNIGEEEIKGNDRVKQTAVLLEQSALNYVGFVEGDDIFAGKVDVIVCDGFVGNVALKASEGVARMLGDIAKEEFTRGLLSKLGALLARPALRALKDRADPRNYNGASLVGLRGIVIKSHGSADALSFAHAIDVAVLETEKAVPERISHLLEEMLAGNEAT